jgi:hypothetical protein
VITAAESKKGRAGSAKETDSAKGIRRQGWATGGQREEAKVERRFGKQ